MMGDGPAGRIVAFCAKFIVFSALLLALWWWQLQFFYVELVGQIAGGILRFIARIPIEAMRVEVDPDGVMRSQITLVYVSEGRPMPMNAAYLVANIPPFLALVFSTPGLTMKRRAKVTAIGLSILFTTHITFLVLSFAFGRQVATAPEIPTAIGLFIMTLPFILWIMLAYWERLMLIFEETST